MRKPSQTRSTIDATQKLLNERFDQLRVILSTMEAYGVKDSDFNDFPLSDHAPLYNLAGSLECAKQSIVDEALDLCEILNSLGDTRKWLFKKKPKDKTTKALLQRLMRLYNAIVG